MSGFGDAFSEGETSERRSFFKVCPRCHGPVVLFDSTELLGGSKVAL